MTYQNLHHKLLEHPFYQAWTAGTITTTQLTNYAHSYLQLVEAMPQLWQKVITDLKADTEKGNRVVAEETEHIALWKNWLNQLPATIHYPHLNETLSELNAMPAAVLLGAIQAFEVQQPAVATSKKEGLVKHYGFDPTLLTYFDEHQNEAYHIDFGNTICTSLSDKMQYKQGFDRGQKMFYDALDVYLN